MFLFVELEAVNKQSKLSGRTMNNFLKKLLGHKNLGSLVLGTTIFWKTFKNPPVPSPTCLINDLLRGKRPFNYYVTLNIVLFHLHPPICTTLYETA